MTLGGYPKDDQNQFASTGGIPALTIAAHELKAPLTLIRQLSLELAQTTDPERIATVIRQIQLTSEKSLRLTSDITKSNRLQTSLFPTSSFNSLLLLREVHSELSPLYGAQNRRLTLTSRKSMPNIVANYDLLRRIVCNFGDNALHYADEKGAVELFLHSQRSQGTVRVGVRDYGPALPKRFWSNIIMPDQTAQALSSRPASSGLGLKIASDFANAIGGQIGAIRHRDGASFYVDVPISKQLSLL